VERNENRKRLTMGGKTNEAERLQAISKVCRNAANAGHDD